MHADILTGREAERAEISAFLGFLASGEATEHTSLYVSGTPGTGKTAFVRQIISQDPAGDLVSVYVNCMGLQEAAVWDAIVEEVDVSHGDLLRGRGKTKSKTGGKSAKAVFEKLLLHDDVKWYVSVLLKDVP